MNRRSFLTTLPMAGLTITSLANTKIISPKTITQDIPEQVKEQPLIRLATLIDKKTDKLLAQNGFVPYRIALGSIGVIMNWNGQASIINRAGAAYSLLECENHRDAHEFINKHLQPLSDQISKRMCDFFCIKLLDCHKKEIILHKKSYFELDRNIIRHENILSVDIKYMIVGQLKADNLHTPG